MVKCLKTVLSEIPITNASKPQAVKHKPGKMNNLRHQALLKLNTLTLAELTYSIGNRNKARGKR